jgi:glycosyltransferase involved in cell wall biosynthesis
VPQELGIEEIELLNPVEAYYRHRAQNHLRVLYRFAVQSRSLTIRDVFAKASSAESLDLGDLLQVIEHLSSDLSDAKQQSLRTTFDGPVLLALADLLANTARDDIDTYSAVKVYDFVYSIFGVSEFSEQQILLFIEALHEAGYYERAELFAWEHAIGEIAPLQPELLALQRVRRTSSAVDSWVDELNELFSGLGMTRVRLLADEHLPLLDRLASENTDPIDGPKVSVIMPTFSPGPGIRTAIRGLLEQTWQNLEIIIVDDASPKEYRRVFSDLGRADDRIRVIHQEQNAGAYVARNAGLAEATGEFITTADDDDWSHPDKIASQVSVLIEDPFVVATTSSHIRTTEELEFRRINSSAKYLQMNYSSLMFRRGIVDEIGGWDTVNRGADSEFFMRMTKYYGSDRLTHLRDQPLALSRVWDGSLTSGEMSRGFIGTDRVLYLWAIRQWHWDLGKLNQKPTRSLNDSRPYAIPSSLEAGQRNRDRGAFDVVYATDFFRQAKFVDYVLKEIAALINHGFRVGYLHLDSPRTDRPEGFPKTLFRSQLESKVTQLSLNDTAETKLLITYDTAVGMFADQTKSRIISHQSILVERELATLSGASERRPLDFLRSLENLDKTFHTKFKIIGATENDQSELANRVPSSRLLPVDLMWYPHVKYEAADIEPPSGKPVVGFHSFGNKYRWPRDRSTFKSIYVSDIFETRFYGQVQPAIDAYGEGAFLEAEVVDQETTSLNEFLADIDFWLYYPHPKLCDTVWEPVLAALGAAKVVILPHRLAPLYGTAAVYASAEEVGSVVSSFVDRPQAYQEQAARAQAFIDGKYTSERLIQRITSLIRDVELN